MTDETLPPDPADAFGPLAPPPLALFDALREAVWVFDIDQHRIAWANRAALALWQATDLHELCRRDLSLGMSHAVATRLRQYQQDFLRHDASFDEQWTLYPEDQPVALNVHYCGYRLPDGRMAMLCQARPVDNPTPESLRSVEVLLHTPVMISLYRADGQPLYRNPAARASARAHDEPLQARFTDTRRGSELLEAALRHGKAAGTMPMDTAQGTRWHEVSAHRQSDAVDGAPALLISEVDVTALKESEARARYLSEHDPLTGLANRDSVRRQIERLRQHPEGASAALMLIDLDRFKDINDSLGHAAGDTLLIEVAERLRSAVRQDDLVARFGGDEFLILLEGTDLRDEIRHIHLRLRDAIGHAVLLAGTEVHIGATVGVSLYPEDGTDFDTLLQHADLAMYAAKARGRNRLNFYHPEMSTSLRQRRHLEDDLRTALAQQQFEVHYQPRVAVEQARIVGAEALVRWRHPRRGLVMPGEFIPVCEATGLIHELGHFVFQQAAQQQATWAARGHDLQLSINLSPREFDDPGLPARLAQSLQASGCQPERLQVEVTESMLMRDDDRPLHTLKAMQALGLSIALDDFGTGYSNLAYLQRFPFQVLKIDRTFVQARVPERPLAEAIVTLSRRMGLSTVAEGVETPEQLRWLAELGVAEYQGFLFSRPLAVAAFDQLLR